MLMRRLLCANSSLRPRARSTELGSRLAEVQAEPEETARPLIPMMSDSPSTKLKLMFRFCGTRRSRLPLLQRPGFGIARLHFGLGNAKGFAHADDLVRRQGARTHAALMAAAVHLRL